MGLGRLVYIVFFVLMCLDFFWLSYRDFRCRRVNGFHFLFWILFLVPLNLFVFKGFFWMGYAATFTVFALTNIGFGDSLMVFTTGLFIHIGNALYLTGQPSYTHIYLSVGVCYLGGLLLKPVFNKEKGVPLIPVLTIQFILQVSHIIFL